MAVFEDAVVCGVNMVGAAEIGGEIGVGGEFNVESADDAVIEELFF